MDERRLRRERAQLRAAMVAEIEQLRTDADEGAMPVEELQERFTSIVERYLGDAGADVLADLDEVITAYGALTEAIARRDFVIGLARSLGVT